MRRVTRGRWALPGLQATQALLDLPDQWGASGPQDLPGHREYPEMPAPSVLLDQWDHRAIRAQQAVRDPWAQQERKASRVRPDPQAQESRER